jgi:hypothetical protein
MPHRSSESFQQITDVLTKSLRDAFDEECPERYGRPLSLQQTEPSSEESISFRITGSETVDLSIRATVSHVGGNVYDIGTQVEDGPVRRFTYSEPDASGSSLSIAPYLGKKIARHLLDEVERHLGKKMLREQPSATLQPSSDHR